MYVALPRRGYGASSQPDSGYDEQRLAAGVLAVMQSLKLTAPVSGAYRRWLQQRNGVEWPETELRTIMTLVMTAP